MKTIARLQSVGGAFGEKWGGGGKMGLGLWQKMEFGAGVPEKKIRKTMGGGREDKIGREWEGWLKPGGRGPCRPPRPPPR